MLQRIFPAGTNVLREDFCALAMRQAEIATHYLKGPRGPKTRDFLIPHGGKDIALAIGGKGKGCSQFKAIRADRKVVLAMDAAPLPERLRLHLAGFLTR